MNFKEKIKHLIFQAEGFKYSGDIIDSMSEKGIYQVRGYQSINPRRDIGNNQQFILENYHLDQEIRNLISESKWNDVRLLSIAGLDYNQGVTDDFYNFLFSYLMAKNSLCEEFNIEIPFLAINNSYYFHSKYSYQFANLLKLESYQKKEIWWNSLSPVWKKILFDNYEISQCKGDFQLVQEQGDFVDESFIDSILNLEYIHIINPVVGDFQILSHLDRIKDLHIYLYNNCLLSGIDQIQNLKKLTIDIRESPWYRIEDEDFYRFSGDQENENFDFSNISKCKTLEEISLRGGIRSLAQISSLGGISIKKLGIIIDNLRMSLQSYLWKDNLVKIDGNTDILSMGLQHQSYEEEFRNSGVLWMKETLDNVFNGISNINSLEELSIFVDYQKEGGFSDKDTYPFIYDMNTLRFSDRWGIKLKNLQKIKLGGEIFDYWKLRTIIPQSIKIEL